VGHYLDVIYDAQDYIRDAVSDDRDPFAKHASARVININDAKKDTTTDIKDDGGDHA
jgi:hypothetical protein